MTIIKTKYPSKKKPETPLKKKKQKSMKEDESSFDVKTGNKNVAAAEIQYQYHL